MGKSTFEVLGIFFFCFKACSYLHKFLSGLIAENMSCKGLKMPELAISRLLSTDGFIKTLENSSLAINVNWISTKTAFARLDDFCFDSF